MSLPCTNCGVTNPVTNSFCTRCGAPLEVTPIVRRPRPSSSESVEPKERYPVSDFVTLSCPTCGGGLQITRDVDRFACAHCGNEHLVRRGGGIITLAPVMEGLAKIQRDTDRTAIELTIRRLRDEIAEAQGEISGLAYEVCRKDHIIISDTLRRMRKMSLSEYMSGSNPTEKEYEHRQRLLSRLSLSELEEFRKKYNRRKRVKARVKRESLQLLDTMIHLQKGIRKRQSQIEAHRRKFSN